MNINERISKVIEYSRLTSSEFADQINVQRSSISHITSGRNKPSLEFVTKIKNQFPDITWDWLISGEGEMLRKEEPTLVEDSNKEIYSPSSLPDLFSMITDDQFGRVEEKSTNPFMDDPRESFIPNKTTEREILSDSQRLGSQESTKIIQDTSNQQDKVKRIVLFYESGKFESFEP